MAEPRVFLKENRGRIEENYLEQAKNLPRVFAPVDEKLQKCTEEVALACKYLYAFMPYSDIGNYPFEVFLDYAENGVRLWKENPQVADLPEEIFLNYVLFRTVQNLFPRRDRKQNTGNELQRSSVGSELLVCRRSYLSLYR